jgi:hypothetical protein
VIDALDVHELDPIEVRDQSSWSCHHGVARWAGECPDVRDGHWKRPLRQAFDRFAAALDALSESRIASMGLDLWALRDRWVEVASGYAEPDAWLEERLGHAPGAGSIAGDQRAELLRLLAAQASRLQMFASDGWFWGDPRRIETAQAMRYAAHAARLADGVLGTNLELALVDDLAAVRAPDVPEDPVAELAHLRTGDQIYVAALSSIGQPPPKR